MIYNIIKLYWLIDKYNNFIKQFYKELQLLNTI
jgi:hypothetical protein